MGQVHHLRSREIVDRLSGIFEKYKNITWKALPEQYENVINGKDGTRLKYDLDVLKAIAPDVDCKDIKEKLITIYIELLRVIR